MVKEMTYSTVATVIESWDNARRNPTFDQVAGLLIMQKLFEFEPRTKAVFGIPSDFDPTTKNLLTTKAGVHGASMVHNLDVMLSLLGPENEMMDDLLCDLARRHGRFGVKAHFYPFMARSVVHVLSVLLGDAWTSELETSWVEVLDAINEMIMKSIMADA